ncbi:hypothetical protein [Streptoalloteichus tenebrarius]|uniref:hypothetical protein n=1 Tax=Streptoalloteichus tenebrarius (strain ATCC 17920 / DSM 40477 / JCM 4838 / CBS 697.72 / NBRC 16177 / NCIMB 11028 / NRRL B-12390 / A12253. 1 / ISP 5477) TaxID=1933 RepID=UPI0020A29B5D|nr:hypothetical protein [Streptoalloteichus tenebrarius]BFE99943.1 hypothetical protein GCM10020241_16190 [Streptoalloteichus tenebrarius]
MQRGSDQRTPRQDEQVSDGPPSVPLTDGVVTGFRPSWIMRDWMPRPRLRDDLLAFHSHAEPLEGEAQLPETD